MGIRYIADLLVFLWVRIVHHFSSDVFSAFNDSSRYLDDIFNIDNPFFDNMAPMIYPKEHKLNKANTSDTSAAFS